MGTGRSIITSVSSGCNYLPTYCQISVSRTSRRQRSSLWGWSIRMRLDTKWQKCLKPFSGKFCLTSVRKFWREKSWDSVTLSGTSYLDKAQRDSTYLSPNCTWGSAQLQDIALCREVAFAAGLLCDHIITKMSWMICLLSRGLLG